MELASEFTNANYEKTFLSILQKAKSNIQEFGNGKDIFNRWVKPAAVGIEKITAQYAIESSFENETDKKESDLYCYKVKRNNIKKYVNLDNILSFGKIDVTSNITFEKKEMSYVILQTQNYDFYCAVKEFNCADDYSLEAKEISKVFKKDGIIETLQAIELYYGSRFYSLKDIPIDRRKTILENMIQSKLQKAAQTYQDMYESLLNPISHLNDLGMDIPEGFRVCAKYTLLSDLDEELTNIKKYNDAKAIERLLAIKQLADKFKIKLNTPRIRTLLSSRLSKLITSLVVDMTIDNTKELIDFFELLEKLNIETEISAAQNTFYEMFCANFERFYEKTCAKFGNNTRELLLNLLEIGRKLNINVNFYKDKVDSLTGKV